MKPEIWVHWLQF